MFKLLLLPLLLLLRLLCSSGKPPGTTDQFTRTRIKAEKQQNNENKKAELSKVVSRFARGSLVHSFVRDRENFERFSAFYVGLTNRINGG